MSYSGTLSPAENLKILLNRQARFPFQSDESAVALVSKAAWNLYDRMESLVDASELANATGTGKVVKQVSPALTTPNIGSATGENLVLSGNLVVSGTTNFATTADTQARNSRAPRQGLVLDGTAGATVANLPAFGTGDFTVGAWVTPSVSSTHTIVSGPTNSFGLRIQTDYSLAVGKVNVSDGTASTSVMPAGKRSFVAYVRSGNTGTYYINGIAAGTSNETGINYSVSCGFVGSFGGTSTQVLVGDVSPIIENRSLSASEILAIYETATIPASDIPAGGAGVRVPTFSLSGGATGTQDATSGNVTFNGGYCNYIYATPLRIGTKVRISFTVAAISGTVQMNQSGTFANYASFSTTGAKSYEVTLTDSSTGFFFTNGTSMQYSGLTIEPLGALLAPDQSQPGAGTMWRDVSGNNATITWSSGISWAVPSGVGDYLSSTVALGSAVSLTTATPANVTSLTLSAGDWDVDGHVCFSLSSATLTDTIAGVSLTSATLPSQTLYTESFRGNSITTTNGSTSQPTPRQRVLITTATTVYLVAFCNFSAGSMSAFGTISARRVR